MKSSTYSLSRYRHHVFALFCGAGLLLSSCTTQNTAYLVKTQPMTVDLEKKVLTQTGLSGMAAGAVAGAALGAVGGAVLGKLAGADANQMKRLMIAGAVAGGAAGGYSGFQQGQQKGQQIVGRGMSRDQLRLLVKGAKAQNQEIVSYNAGLRKQIAATRQMADPRQKKIAAATLRKQTEGKLKDVDARIALRDKALASQAWSKQYGSERSEYRSLKNSMVNDRNVLVAQLNDVSKLDQSTVY